MFKVPSKSPVPCVCNAPKPSRWLEGHCLVCLRSRNTSHATCSQTPSPQFKPSHKVLTSLESPYMLRPEKRQASMCSDSCRSQKNFGKAGYRSTPKHFRNRSRMRSPSRQSSKFFKIYAECPVPELRLPCRSSIGTPIFSIREHPQEEILNGHTNSVNDLTILGRNLVSAGHDYQLIYWKNPRQRIVAHSKPVKSITALNHAVVASGSDDNKIKYWNGTECTGLIKGINGGVQTLCTLSPVTFASGSRDIDVWDIESRQLVHKFKDSFKSVSCLALSGPANLLSGGWDSSLKLWDLRANRNVKTYTAHNGPLTSVLVWDDNSFYSAGQDCTLIKWDLRTGGILQKYHEDVNTMQVMDGKLVTGAHSLKLWEGNSAIQLQNNIGTVKSLVFDEDSYVLYAGSKDGLITAFRPAY